MTEVAVSPSLPGPAPFDDRHTPRQRFGTRRSKREMPHSRRLRCSELQRVVFVIVPTAQVDGVTAAGGFGHAHDVDEEIQALVRLGCEDFKMPEVREIERADRGLHSLKST